MAANRRILVIDDDPSVRDAYRQVFAALLPDSRRDEMRSLEGGLFGSPTSAVRADAYQFTYASQGEEGAAHAAKAQADALPFAVAFVDMRMPPGWDGLRTITELWTIDPRMQVVVCTAYSDWSHDEIVARLGRSDRLLILKKPFDPIEVVQLAENQCAKWNLERIAEQHLAEAATARLRLRSIIDNTQAIISLKDRDGRYILANRAFATRFRIDERSAEGRTDADLFPAQAAILSEREAKARAGRYHESEEEDPRLGGTSFLTVRFVIEDLAGTPGALCTIANDITVVKQLEAQFHHTQRLESLGRLAGGVAHDFNNLLAVIGGFTELVLMRLGNDPSRTQDDLRQVLKAVDSASNLTRQLLAFSRRQPVSPQRLDLNAVIAEMRRMLQRLLGETVSLRFVPCDRPLPVMADRSQIQQVLVNLLVNARDAMPQGGDITIATGLHDEAVWLSVEDTGQGIPASIIERIWEPFFTTKEAGKGTGLGLATVHGIVHAAGGRASVESEPGRGSRFRISLPLNLGASTAPDAETGAVRAGRGEHILVVEDQQGVRSMLDTLLTSAGYRVTACSGLAEAEAVTAGEAIAGIDMVLSDVVMPGCNGPDLAARLRLRRPDLRIRFISGYADLPEPLDPPPLWKPFSRASLLSEVGRTLDA